MSWNFLIVCDPEYTKPVDVFLQYMWILFRGYSPTILLGRDNKNVNQICQQAYDEKWTLVPLGISTERSRELWKIASGCEYPYSGRKCEPQTQFNAENISLVNL